MMTVVACPAAAQTALRPGQTVQGELTASDPTLGDGSHYDCFTIQTRPGQTLQIDQVSDAFDSYLQAGSGACSSNLDNAVSDDDSGGGVNARLQVQGDGGVLTVRANSLSEGMTGRYTLTVAEIGQGTASVRPAAAAAQVRTAHTNPDPFDASAVFIASNEPSAAFGLPMALMPGGLRRFPVLQMFKTEQRYGTSADGAELFVDALLADYVIDCSANRYRIGSLTGYFRRAPVDSTSGNDAFETPEEGTIPFEVVKAGCHPEQLHRQRDYPDYASKIARMRQVD
tara:strand:+ start:792 stop:1643 length:852 start_codon:yes stop_codon:yes gene_type:complete